MQSTEFLTDQDGKIQEHNEYFAFGETWVDERRDLDNDGRQDYMFTGKELDPHTNLYYFGARYYDPQVSRWESADPVFGDYVQRGLDGGLHAPRNLATYSYGWNNPIVLHDDGGRFVDTILDVGFIGYDLFRIAKDNVLGDQDNLGMNLAALGLDVGFALIPGATGGGAALRSGKLLSDARRPIQAAVKTEQAARALEHAAEGTAAVEHGAASVEKTAEAGQAAGAAPTHGNSLASQTEQHVYEITQKKAGEAAETYKYGVSGAGETAGGLSGRAEAQVRKLARENPGVTYQSKIVDRVAGGPGARTRVLSSEKEFVKQYRELHKGARPPGNKRP